MILLKLESAPLKDQGKGKWRLYQQIQRRVGANKRSAFLWLNSKKYRRSAVRPALSTFTIQRPAQFGGPSIRALCIMRSMGIMERFKYSRGGQ
jgi:hypothetical protein